MSNAGQTVECGQTANVDVNLRYAVRFPNGTPGISAGQPLLTPRFALSYPGGSADIGPFSLPIEQTHSGNGDVTSTYKYQGTIGVPVTVCDQPLRVTLDQEESQLPAAHSEKTWTVMPAPTAPEPPPVSGTGGGGGSQPTTVLVTPTAPAIVAPAATKVVYSLTAIKTGKTIKIRSNQTSAQTLCFFRHAKKQCMNGKGSWNLGLIKGDGKSGKQYLTLLVQNKVVARAVVRLTR